MIWSKLDGFQVKTWRQLRGTLALAAVHNEDPSFQPCFSPEVLDQLEVISLHGPVLIKAQGYQARFLHVAFPEYRFHAIGWQPVHQKPHCLMSWLRSWSKAAYIFGLCSAPKARMQYMHRCNCQVAPSGLASCQAAEPLTRSCNCGRRPGRSCVGRLKPQSAPGSAPLCQISALPRPWLGRVSRGLSAARAPCSSPCSRRSERPKVCADPDSPGADTPGT